MNFTPCFSARAAIGFIVVGLAVGSILKAEDERMATALYARVSPDYHRKKLPDGTFAHEHFAIANGGFVPSAIDDEYVKKVRFVDVANMVLRYLGPRGYYLAQNGKRAELLIVVKWGTTTPFSDDLNRTSVEQASTALDRLQTASNTNVNPKVNERGDDGIISREGAVRVQALNELNQTLAMQNAVNGDRQMVDAANARLLGYMDEINARDNISQYFGAGTSFRDLWDEIEAPRYFVILEAYDFIEMQEHHTPKVLWTLRVSVQAQHNRFDQCLATMISRASEYAGKSSRYLIREDKAGTVSIGELKELGVATEPAVSDKK